MARNRGAQSLIATFEDEPYRAPFSGNVIELCPVGALTSTQYRFEARPWEIQNVPTVCGLCPVGCNVSATTREGKVKRILSRNHPEVDEGWLCDKGRFAYPAPVRRRPDRSTRSSACAAAASSELSWDDALDRAEAAAARRRGTDRHGALRLRDRRAGLRARQAAAPGARRALGRAARRRPRFALDAFRAPLSTIARRRDRRRHRRRGGRGPRADRRPLDQAGAPQRRRGRRGSAGAEARARSSSSASPTRTARS